MSQRQLGEGKGTFWLRGEAWRGGRTGFEGQAVESGALRPEETRGRAGAQPQGPLLWAVGNRPVGKVKLCSGGMGCRGEGRGRKPRLLTIQVAEGTAPSQTMAEEGSRGI